MFKLPLLLSDSVIALLGFVGLLCFLGLIVLGVILFKKKFRKFDIEKPDMTEEQVIQEELNRVLVPIEDELVEKSEEKDEQKK